MEDLMHEDLSNLTDEELEQSTLALLRIRRLTNEQDASQKTVTLFDEEMEDLHRRILSQKGIESSHVRSDLNTPACAGEISSGRFDPVQS